MATLTIRKLDDKVYAKLGERARRNNRSLEAEVRTMLEEQTFDINEWIGQLRARRADSPLYHPPGEDAVSVIRAMRDER
jgi:plasmid stability protein